MSSSTGLNLYSLPETDYRYQSRREIAYNPVTAGIQPITFNVPASDDYINLKEIQLEIQVKLDISSDNNYTGLDPAAPANDGTTQASTANSTKTMVVVNNFAHSIFKQMDVKFNGILMGEQSNYYAYLAYMDTLLNYSKEEARDKLVPQGWIDGAVSLETSQFDVTNDALAAGNADDRATYKALRPLADKLKSKRWYTFVITPHIPAFHSGAFLAPGVSLEMELHLNPNTFYLFGTPNKGAMTVKRFPTITQDDIKVKLIIPKYSLNASVYNKLQSERSLSKKTVKYPVVRPSIRTFVIPTGQTTWEEDNVFLGKFPDRVIIGLVHTDGFNGTYDRYPFAFERFGLTHIRQLVNGEEYPYRTLELSNVTNQKHSTDALGYHRLIKAMGAYREHKQPMVQPEDWGEGKTCTLFMFNNVPSGFPDDPNYRNPQQTGIVRYQITFAAATTHNITVVVWSEYENTIEINSAGGIRYNV